MAHVNAIRQTLLLTTALPSKCPVLKVVIVVVVVVSVLAVLPPSKDLHLTISSSSSPFQHIGAATVPASVFVLIGRILS